MKQTAVEWLVNCIESMDWGEIITRKELYAKAKEMEKDELSSALNFGYMDGLRNKKTWSSFEQYYKWRYNK
jgi:hypothetical protein